MKSRVQPHTSVPRDRSIKIPTDRDRTIAIARGHQRISSSVSCHRQACWANEELGPRANLSLLMPNEALQLSKAEFVICTAQLLDLLELLKRHKKTTRRQMQDYIYQHWRTQDKVQEFQGIKIAYNGQPEGVGTQHTWKVDISSASDDKLVQRLGEIQRQSRLPILVGRNQNNQGQNAPTEWNGLFFRSPAEVSIAKVLDQRNILFFPNARGRVSDRGCQSQTVEVDFLIFYSGRSGLLEVDGATYHQGRAAEDHRRDRLFFRQGILCSRFDAMECQKTPETVIDEFLESLLAFMPVPKP